MSRAISIIFYGKHYFIYSQKSYAHHILSFSQEGEDLVLNRLFDYVFGQDQGFYVDVGAHHPQRFSNTYFFYLKGWRGINIDAMPGSMKCFDKLRPYDINIEAAISNQIEHLTYYIFNEPALNSFSETLSISRDNDSNYFSEYHIVNKKQIKTQKLSKILDEHLPQGQNIDFLNIDVEGLDYQVLLSNDWSRYKPKIILIEELSASLWSVPQQSKTFYLLQQQGYELFAKTCNTLFYKLVDTQQTIS